LSCALCETRKERRFCPAVHGKICPVCCGTEREVTLDCPSDCPYLQLARAREKPRPLVDMNPEAVFSTVTVRDQLIYEREPLLVGLSYAVAKCARADRSLNDRDAISALTALARRYQTLVGSGLRLNAATPVGAQQATVAELEKMIAEYQEMEGKHLGYATLRDSETLEALVFLVRMAHARTSGRPKARGFLDFLFRQFPAKQGEVVSAEDAKGSIVIP